MAMYCACGDVYGNCFCEDNPFSKGDFMSRTKKGSKGPGWEPWSNLKERQEQQADYKEDEDLEIPYFELSPNVFEGLNKAKKFNMEDEFLETFLKFLGLTNSQVEEAVNYALREWDL